MIVFNPIDYDYVQYDINCTIQERKSLIEAEIFHSSKISSFLL